jgi:hypothetical protein
VKGRRRLKGKGKRKGKRMENTIENKMSIQSPFRSSQDIPLCKLCGYPKNNHPMRHEFKEEFEAFMRGQQPMDRIPTVYTR